MAGALAASSSCVVQAFVQQRELLAAHKDLGDAWRVNGLTASRCTTIFRDL